MSQPDFNPFDPISAAMGAMHGQNLLAAKDARIKQLEAEVERLRIAGGESEPRFVFLSDYRHLKAERDTLKAEVERLTKAGDAMHIALNLADDVFDNHEKDEAQEGWIAAKDGKANA